ncbi:MAG: hypothetical protein M3Y72_07890 [Acidobacteriota bacterium]|nr:hypothetical protein [Acidobacteriota bacterium]
MLCTGRIAKPLAWFILALSFGLAGRAAQNSGYVGSKTCYGCHAEIYKSFSKTDMGRSLRPASDLNGSSVPNKARVPIGSDGRVARVFQDDAGWRQSEEQPGVFTDEHELAYITGSGRNGLSFIVRRGNAFLQAPLSYYSKTGRWDLSPGYEQADIGFSRAIPEECIACHSGRARPVETRKGEYLDPPFAEMAIGCENCHGPGEAHAHDPKRAASIVNPGKLTPRLAEEICMNCHQRGDARVLQPGKHVLDFRPGEWTFETIAIFKIPTTPGERKESDLLEHNTAMKDSRCFLESRGRLSCLTCHDAHVQPGPNESVAYFRAKCFTCHTDESCHVPVKQRAAQNPADNCTGCHMPKREVAGIAHSALTNHRIPARTDEPMPEAPKVNKLGLIVVNEPAGNATVPDDTLLRAYGELAGVDASYQARYLELLSRLAETRRADPLVEAALGHKALAEGGSEAALAHLSKGLQLHEPAVYVDMAKALLSIGREGEAAGYLQQASELDPYDFTILKMLILQNIKLKNYSEARAGMEKYVSLWPEDSFMRDLLRRVSK